MPHVKDPAKLHPAIHWSMGRTNVSLVLGIPTVLVNLYLLTNHLTTMKSLFQRDKNNYLNDTLDSVFANVPENDQAGDILVIVFIAEANQTIAASIAGEINVT